MYKIRFHYENVYTFSYESHVTPKASPATKNRWPLTGGQSLWAGLNLKGKLRSGSPPGCTLLMHASTFLPTAHPIQFPRVLPWVPTWLLKRCPYGSRNHQVERKKEEKRKIPFFLLQRRSPALKPGMSLGSPTFFT